jgi:hypothetical protein
MRAERIVVNWSRCLAAGLGLWAGAVSAAEFPVTDAQGLQNALTLAAVNGEDDVITLAAGYYAGNFNFNSAESGSLTIQGATGTTNTDITIDGAGGGRDLNLACTANAAITVRGITFSRNCAGNAALRIATGTGIGADVVVEDCRFISPPATTGVGLEIASSKSATINRCSAIGVSGGGGNGMTVTTGNAIVQNCTFATNSSYGLTMSLQGDLTIADSQFIGQMRGMDVTSTGLNATMSRCFVSGTGTGRGAAIKDFSGMVLVRNCSFFKNYVRGTDGSDINGTPTTAEYGAGLYVRGANHILVTNNAFANNSAVSSIRTLYNYTQTAVGGSGGGAFLVATRITVNGNTFTTNSGNTAENPSRLVRGGSALGCEATAIEVTNNYFLGNSGSMAAYAFGAASLTGNSFVNNSGGGIQCDSSSSVSGNAVTGSSGTGIQASGTIISNSVSANSGTGISGSGTISGNTVSGSGGAGIAGSGTISGNTVTDSGGVGISGNGTISGNKVVGNRGGGIVASGTPIISRNVVLRNQTTSANGAGIRATGDTIKLFDNVVAGNAAPSAYKGGGIYLTPSVRLELVNNTVTGNSAGNGGGVAISISGVTELLYAYNNILWGNTASGNGADVWLTGTGSRKEFFNNNAHGMYGVWDIAQNGLDIAPLFYDPVNSDYHLRGGSPCIDAGTNVVALLPALDLDGNPRIANSLVDMGAYEFFNTSTHPADTNINWQVESPEFDAYAAAWKADQAWASNAIPADYLTRAGYLKAKGGAYTNDGSALPLNWKPR